MLAINDPASPLPTLPTRPTTNGMGIAAFPTTSLVKILQNFEHWNSKVTTVQNSLFE